MRDASRAAEAGEHPPGIAWILKAHPGSTDRNLDLFRLLKFGRDFGRDSLDKPRFSRQSTREGRRERFTVS